MSKDSIIKWMVVNVEAFLPFLISLLDAHHQNETMEKEMRN